MPIDNPFDEATFTGDILDQVIVGFVDSLGEHGLVSARSRVEKALANLATFGAEEITSFVERAPDEQSLFAVAVVRLRNPEVPLGVLQQKLAEKDEKLIDIASLERNGAITMDTFNDTLFRAGQQWALPHLGVEGPWTVAPPATHAGTILAIVDSGVLLDDGYSLHKDLPPAAAGNGVDRDGHGTLLAGTLAAYPDNNEGIASAIPASWNIQLFSAQFFSPRVEPSAALAALAIAYAVINGAKVINASWHLASADAGLWILKQFIEIAAKFSVVVLAAGNDGTNNEVWPTWPANLGGDAALKDKVMTVLATGPDDSKAFFSNYGPNKVTIGAPGLHILSTERYQLDGDPYPWEWSAYGEYSGTSPASAFVSAGAALVFALHPAHWDGANASAWRPADVVQHLHASAVTVEGLKPLCAGGKRLHLARAVYGPLQVTAPGLDDELPVNTNTFITWRNKYPNPRFTKVKIEFSKDDGVTYTTLDPTTNNDGQWKWKPAAGDATSLGRIRITPVRGNFPAVSEPFRVV